MKITNTNIIEIHNGLIAFTKERLPVKVSFAIAKNLSRIKNAYADYETARNKLLDEFNVKNENGKPAYLETGKIQIEPQHITEWNKEIAELLNIETDVQVHEIDYADIEQLELSIQDMVAMEFMIR